MNPAILDLILAEARKFFREHPEEREKAQNSLLSQQKNKNLFCTVPVQKEKQ